MKQVSKNPTKNRNITIGSAIDFTATGEGGLITGTGFGVLSRGQRVRLTVTGGTAQGFTTDTDYFVIPYANHVAISGSAGGTHDGNYFLQTPISTDGSATFYKHETEDYWITNITETEIQYWGITTERSVPADKDDFLYLTAGDAVLSSSPNFVGQGDQTGTTASSTWNSGTKIALASTRSDALKGTPITTTGDAGAGTLSPSYTVGGVLYVGTSGDINVRGLDTDTFSVLKSVSGTVPFMVGEIHSVDTTASDIVAWYD